MEHMHYKDEKYKFISLTIYLFYNNNLKKKNNLVHNKMIFYLFFFSLNLKFYTDLTLIKLYFFLE